MGFKSFLMKKTLQLKGVPKDQAEKIATELAEHPEMAESLKKLQSDPEVKELFENIQKEVEEKKKSGMQEMYATVQVMEKYKSQIMKHRDALEPLMRLMQK